MAVVAGPSLAFQSIFTSTPALSAPTVDLSTLSETPDPVSMTLVLTAQLLVSPPDEVGVS